MAFSTWQSSRISPRKVSPAGDEELADLVGQMMKVRLECQRAGDRDALALTAGELMRIASDMAGIEADLLQKFLRRAPAIGPSAESRDGSRNASAMSSPAVMRGLSDWVGS